MGASLQPNEIQAFLRLLNARISDRECKRNFLPSGLTRTLLKTEIAELRVIRREYTKMFAQHLSLNSSLYPE